MRVSPYNEHIMATAQDPYIKPGVDNKTHEKALANSVAANINDALGAQITPTEVMPPANQKIVVEGHENAANQAGDQLDIEDIIAGEQGKPRNEPSQNFLRKLLGRIKKQHPDNRIEVVEK